MIDPKKSISKNLSLKSNHIREQESFTPLCIAAEQILSTALNTKVKIERLERMTEAGRRNLLIRCWIDPVENLPTSFIIKKVEGDYNCELPNSPDTRRLFNDWIGTQFLNTVSVELNHSPRFYGGDRNLGLIVIEDVQHQYSLVEPLLEGARFLAERSLLQYAICLGKLHRDTVGKVEEFEQLYRTLAPQIEFTRNSLNIQQIQSQFNSLSIELDSDCLRDIETINTMIIEPGEFLTYTHTDACPDNVLDTGNGLQLIDFETGRFGHAFIDAACGRMMFPSCWCSKTLPLNLIEQMENTYRAILIEKCPILEDDLIFNTALINACGMWLMYTILRHLKPAFAKDENFGVSTIRQRILARLQTFITLSAELNQLNGLRNFSSRLLDLLNQRWLDVPELSFYPAFTEE